MITQFGWQLWALSFLAPEGQENQLQRETVFQSIHSATQVSGDAV